MEVKMRTRSEEELEDYDWRDEMTIEVDGKQVFQVADGEMRYGVFEWMSKEDQLEQYEKQLVKSYVIIDDDILNKPLVELNSN